MFEDKVILDFQKMLCDYFLDDHENIFDKILINLIEKFGVDYKKIVIIESIFFNRYDEFGFFEKRFWMQ